MHLPGYFKPLKKQRGNALFLILIAVALFAALAYAVTKSGRSGGNINRETAQLKASRIMQYGSQVENAIQRMSIIDRVPARNLDFGSDIYSQWWASTLLWGDNPNCLNADCRIYQSNGGTVPDALFVDATDPSYTVPHSTGLPWPGHPHVFRTLVVNMGTSAEDLVLMVTNLDLEVCKAIDRAIGIPAVATGGGEGFGSWGDAYNENLDTGGFTETLGNDEPAITGRSNACLLMGNFGYTYFHVVLAR